MRFRLHISPQGGSLRVTCLEAFERPFEELAAFAFDLPCFRKLLVENFLLDASLFKDKKREDDASILRVCFRILFPTSSASAVLSQWFRSFVKAHLEEFNVLKII